MWFNNVEMIALKEIGRETVQYVSNIYKYYIAYQHAMEQMKKKKKKGWNLSAGRRTCPNCQEWGWAGEQDVTTFRKEGPACSFNRSIGHGSLAIVYMKQGGYGIIDNDLYD